ncbi:MAG: hypothetical protein ACRDYC_11645 [Acidimicrobiales bacterium]
MGTGEIVGFGVSWLLLTSLLLWAVLTEKRRGDARVAHPAGRAGGIPVARGWTMVEVIPGAAPDDVRQGQYLFEASLAARGLDLLEISPKDFRAEVVPGPDGRPVTRFLLRSRVLHTAARR